MLLEEITAFARTVEPVLEPVDLALAKEQLRVDTDDEDGYINTLITVARDYAEDATGLALLTQTLKVVIDKGALPGDGIIELPRPPLQAVTGITYIDTDGASQTLSTGNYTVDTVSRPGRILFEDLPSIKATLNALVITYTAGYTAAALIPPAIRHAILILITDWFEFRGSIIAGVTPSTVPRAADHLLRSKKLYWL